MPTKSKSATRSPRFLVLLFGTVEFDGRVQRMIELLSSLGTVTLVDVDSETVFHKRISPATRHVRVILPHGCSKVSQHLKVWSSALKACRRERPDIVVAEDFFTTLPAWLLAKVFQARLIYDAHELIIPGAGIRQTLRDRVWYTLERWVAPRANLVITANQERARLMANHYRLHTIPEFMRNIPTPHHHAPDDLDLDVFVLYPALLKRTTEERIILYQGAVSASRGLARFVHAMEFLPRCYRLIIAGHGPDLDDLIRQAAPLKEHGRFASLGNIPHRLLSRITATADVGIIAYPYQGLNNLYCAPNKLFEYAQANVPILATDQPPLASIIRHYDIGRLINEHASPREVAGMLREVAEKKEQFQARLEPFLSEHQWADEKKRISSAIRGLLPDSCA